jgi:hypothetical protein
MAAHNTCAYSGGVVYHFSDVDVDILVFTLGCNNYDK